MVYKKYSIANNAICSLDLEIDESTVTLNLAGNYGRLPASNFIIKVTEYDTDGTTVIGRENMYVTTRTGAVCTGVTRAYEEVPIDDAAATNIQQALPFSAGSTVEGVSSAEVAKDIQNELTAVRAESLPKAGGAMTGAILQAQSTDKASATTTDLSTMTGDSGIITGTTTITGFGTVQAGTIKHLTFSGILTLTYNATSMILPKAWSNITTAAGDTGIFRSLWSGNWICISYTKADGTALVSTSAGSASTSAPGIIEILTDAEALAFADTSRAATAYQLLLAGSVPEQEIPYATWNTTSNVTSLRWTTSTDGLIWFLCYNSWSNQVVLQRYVRETVTQNWVQTHQANFNGSSGVDNACICCTTSYLWLIYSDSGVKSMRRYAIADLSGVTTITVSGTTWTQWQSAFSDGTDIYVYTTNNVFSRYTISGTTVTYNSDVTYTSSDTASNGGATCDGTNVWIIGAAATATVIRKYALAGGAVINTTTRYVNYDAYSSVSFSKVQPFIAKIGALGIAHGHRLCTDLAIAWDAIRLFAIAKP